MMRTRRDRSRDLLKVALALLVLATLVAPVQARQPAKEGKELPGRGRATQLAASSDYVPREVLVRFERGTPKAAEARIHSSVHGRVVEALLLPDTYRVRLPRGLSVRDAVKRYETSGDVLHASPNYRRYLTAAPNDPLFDDLWGLNNTGQSVDGTPGTSDADSDVLEAWDIAGDPTHSTTGADDIVVAVIDDGVNIEHPDLVDNIYVNQAEATGSPGVDDDDNGVNDDVNGFDFADGDNDVLGAGTHGTHVAGTIGAQGNNGIGITGVNWDVSLLPIRIFTDNGASPASALINAYVYAGSEGARVANASFGGFGGSQIEVDALLASPNTLFVASAGNDGADNDEVPTYPCNYALDNVVCVAATDQDDVLATFSNYGAQSVHIAAPGTNILSTTSKPFYTNEFDQVSDLNTWTIAGSWARSTPGLDGSPGLLSDSPGVPYASNLTAANNSAASPVVSLVNTTACRLDHSIEHDLQLNQDFLDVQASTDGASWTTVASYTGNNFNQASPDFVPGLPDSYEVGLPSLVGSATARFRYVMRTNATTQRLGVAIDHVALDCHGATTDTTGYQYFQGTSMAAPHVSGAAALIADLQPGANPYSMRLQLMTSAEPFLGNNLVVSGRLNVDGFLGRDATPPPTPTLSGSALTRVFQSKASVPMTISAPGATAYTVWDSRTKYNSVSPGWLFYNAPTSSVSVPAAAGFTHCFRATSREPGTGNESNFSAERCTAVPVNNTAMKHSAGWTKKNASGTFLNTYSQTSRKGATLSLSNVIYNKLALVATKCRGCGTVGIFYNNARVPSKKISLGASRTKKLQIISVLSLNGGPFFFNKVTVKVLSSSRPVKIEGFGVFQR